jgi:uncharacterized protein
MKKLTLSLVFALSLSALSAPAYADATSHRKVALKLCETLGMAKMMNSSIDVMLKGQVQANPQLASKEPQMRAFFAKYLSWESLKEDFLKIYMEAFTEAELTQLIAFYETPVGKKTLSVMPTLMEKGSQLGISRVQEHIAELQKAVQEPASAASKPAKAK